MIAISPTSRRLTRSLVRLLSRTGPTTRRSGSVLTSAPSRRPSSPRSLPLGLIARLCGSQQIPCVPAGGLVLAVGAEHPDDLGVAAVAADGLDPGHRGVAGSLLDDPEVRRGERGDLGEMGDADDLPPLPERSQPLADPARHLAADAGVDLVEGEGLDVAGLPGS